jgi:hypothetical protein
MGVVMRTQKASWTKIFLVLILILPTLSVSCVQPIDATNSQGMSYTIEMGIYNYTLKAIPSTFSSTPSGEHAVYVNLSALLPMQEIYTDPSEFRLTHDSHYTMYFENGTVYPYGYYWFMVLPTGNWSAMQEIWGSVLSVSLPSVSWINTAEIWGFDAQLIESDRNERVILVFSKSSGLTLHYHAIVYRDQELKQDEEFILDSYDPSAESATSNEPTSEGLEWGLSQGTSISYICNVETEYTEIDSLKLDVRVDFLFPIPDPLNHITDVMLGSNHFTIFHENGTIYRDLALPLIWTAFPIGNFDLLKEKFQAAMIDQTERILLDTSSSWGLKEIQESEPYRSVQIFLFSKSDGALDRCLYEEYLDGTRYKLYELIRVGFVPGEPLDLIIVAVGGFGLVVAIVLIVYLVKKR